MYNFNDELAMYQQQIVRKQRLEEILSNLDTHNYELEKKTEELAVILNKEQNDVEKIEPRNERVIKRNEMALKIAEKYKLPVCDLYSVLSGTHEYHAVDGVHLKEPGCELLAKTIAEKVREVING